MFAPSRTLRCQNWHSNYITCSSLLQNYYSSLIRKLCAQLKGGCFCRTPRLTKYQAHQSHFIRAAAWAVLPWETLLCKHSLITEGSGTYDILSQYRKKKLFTRCKTDRALSSWSNSKQHPIIEFLPQMKTFSEVWFFFKRTRSPNALIYGNEKHPLFHVSLWFCWEWTRSAR